MAKQLLIYERAVPVNRQRHANWSVKTGKDFTFAQQANAVPLIAVEFQSAAAEYAIVFAGQGDTLMPMVILGVRDQENRYLTDTGGWGADYVPAFVRRYPFVFSSSDEGANFALCIDEDFAGCNQEGRGERLFDADGEQTQYLGGVLEFLRQYQARFQRTQAFCKKLKDLDVLEPMQAQFTLGTGEQMSLAGFLAVSRERLKTLSAEQLLDLVRTDELELVYLHLQSMRNFSAMVQRTPHPVAGEDEQAASPQAPVDKEPVEKQAADTRVKEKARAKVAGKSTEKATKKGRASEKIT